MTKHEMDLLLRNLVVKVFYVGISTKADLSIHFVYHDGTQIEAEAAASSIGARHVLYDEVRVEQ